MAHQPVPFPSPREQQPMTESNSPARNFELVEPANALISIGEDMAALREQIRTEALDLDAILDQIVHHARALTGSDGAAVALRQGTVILCRARSGETSPPLGAQLNADSGISGECLRTGKALCCEDSETDLRLDPEVCRQLGLRSIAVVPIFVSSESTTVAGILEVFASQPRTFDDRHLEILEQLAELITAVVGRVTQENQDTISKAGPRSEKRPETPVAAVNSYASSSRSAWLREWTAPAALRSLLTNRLTNSRATNASRRYYAAAIAVFAFAALLAVFGWKTWHRTEHAVVPSTEILAQAKPAPAGVATPGAATMETQRQLNLVEPGAVSRSAMPKPAASPSSSAHSSKGKAQKAALTEQVSGDDDVKATITVQSVSGKTRDRVATANDPEPQPPAPSIGTTGGSGKDVDAVGSALSVQANLPYMASQGVSGGALERKVQPIYPAQARSTRLQGPVVLQAVIDEVGAVQNLKTVSGDPVLAQAAIDAVRQWRYQPYLLNGQPVKMPIQITVNFTLP
jgi:TonB family protein